MNEKFDPITGEPLEMENENGVKEVEETVEEKAVDETVVEKTVEEETVEENPVEVKDVEQETVDENPVELKTVEEETVNEETVKEETFAEGTFKPKREDEFDPNTEISLGEEKSSLSKSMKSGRGIAALVILVLACVVLVAGAVKAGVFQSKNDLLNNAFTKLFRIDSNSTMNSIFGTENFYKNSVKSGLAYGGELEVVDYQGFGQLQGATLSLDVAGDTKQGKAFAGFEIGDKKVIDAEIFMDRENFALYIPQLLEQVLTLNITGDMKEKLNNSALANYMDESQITAMAEYFEMYAKSEDMMESQVKYLKNLKDSKDRFFDGLTIEKVESQSFEINKDMKKLKGYHTTISSEAFIQLLKDVLNNSMDYTKEIMPQSALENQAGLDVSNQENLDEMMAALEQVLENIDMTVYLYKGEIAYLLASTTVNGYGVKYELQFKGGKSLKENMTSLLSVDIGYAEVLINLDRTTTETNDEYSSVLEGSVNGIKITLDNKYNKKTQEYAVNFNAMDQLTFVLEGKFTEIKAGKSVAADISKMSIASSGYELGSLKGNIYWNLLDEKLSMPSGTTVDLLAVSNEELDELIAKMQENMMVIENDLMGLFY